MDNMLAGQNHSNFALNTRLSAPRYDTWCKIQVIPFIIVFCGQLAIKEDNNTLFDFLYKGIFFDENRINGKM